MEQPPKQDWRRQRGGQRSRQPAAAESKDWQARRKRAADTTIASHRVKLAVLGMLVVGLLVTFILIVILWPKKTPLLVLAVTEYSTALPPNAYTQEDIQRLEVTNSDNLLFSAPTSVTQDQRSLMRELENKLTAAEPGGPAKDVVLLYLSAHGVVDGAGEPCLLLSNSRPSDAGTWIRVREVLELLKKYPAPRKILLLDCGRIDDDWSLGVLYNSFAEQLEKLLAESAVPRLHVLNSTSAGQRAWSAPELGGSVFGYYVAMGLQGEASRNDKRITIGELVNYVTNEVTRFVGEQRHSVQTPRLLTPLTKDQDFPVAYTAGAAKLSPVTSGQQGDERQRILAAWKPIHESWQKLETLMRDRQLLRVDPIMVSRIQRHLLAMESLALAGRAYAGKLSEMDGQVRPLLEVDARLRPPPDTAVFSLPLEQQMVPVDAAGGSDAAEEVLAEWLKQRGKPVRKKDDPPPPRLDYRGASRVAWGFLNECPADRPRLVDLRDLVHLVDSSAARSSIKGAPLPDVVEILFVRMLSQFLDLPGGSSEFSGEQRTAVRAAIANRTLAERAATPNDERLHYWIQPLVNQGDEQRRMMEDKLFCDDIAAGLSAGTAAEAAYQQAIERGTQLAEVYQLRDEVWNGLPFLAAWVLRSPATEAGRGLSVSTDQLFQDVQLLAVRNHELAAQLDKTLVGGTITVTPEILALAADVRKAWRELADSYVGHCQALKERGSQDKPTLRDIAGVLRVPTPLLEADERERLATAMVNILFESSPVSSGVAANPAASGDSPSRPGLVLAAMKKDRSYLHPVMQMLGRSTYSLLLNRRERQAELQRGEEADEIWLARQGERVRQWSSDLDAAAKDLEDDTKNRLKDSLETPANIRAGVSEADRLVRASASIVPDDVRDSPRRMRQVDHHLQLLWFARRTLDDFWGSPPGSESRSAYFAQVAAAYLDSARHFDDTPTTPRYDGTDLRALLAARQTALAGTKLIPNEVRTLGDSSFAPQNTHIDWHQDLAAPGTAALFFEALTVDNARTLVPVRDADAHDWRRQSLPVGNSPAVDKQQLIPVDKLPQKSELQLFANLLYRGNLLRSPFDLRGPEVTLTSTVAPTLPPNARVTVRGEGNKKAFITFIIDCSESMRTIDAGIRRMSAAKDALFDVLRALPLNDNYYVGLRAYAHRYTFNRAGQAVDRAGNAVAENPNRDVEILVRIEQLTGQQRAEIEHRATTLSELGVTPLYYSIIQALRDEERDFWNADPEDLQHIVVITDGANYEYLENPAFPEGTTQQQVLDAIAQQARQGRKKVVDIVLFQEQALTPQNRAKVAEIKQIAQQAGGHYYSANDREQLVTAIRKALSLLKFSVLPVGTTEPGPGQTLDLGRTYTIDFPPQQPGPYEVSLYGQSGAKGQVVQLEGGEWVRLDYDKAGNQLVFPKYDDGSLRQRYRDTRLDEYWEEPVIDPVSKESFHVRPFVGRLSRQGALFGIALQNTERTRFTYRPRHVWAEITPLTATGKPIRPANVFYDLEFVPEMPVPVMKFVVQDWPAESRFASVQLWFRFTNPPPKSNGQATIQSLEQVTIPEDLEHATFEATVKQIGEGASDWRLTVVERHDAGTGLYSNRIVSRVQSQPLADLISHRFYLGVGEARHVFDYKERPAPTVVVTDRDRIVDPTFAISVPRFIVQVEE